ncbi:MAG TPA: tRNA (adenosine(37)-N6)-threonylcarbamoyltransferase complex dimerization subunit type 1 TsaB [Croceibacterium sp.]|nr:tRNA (adenosine(37)-N6)-threonylcarbamoyltransferase complex dimerization subunit type 1 TsaB [Croceibacterium sp.]
MRTLVIDSATEACSAAVFEQGELVAGDYAVIGRGHAERLVPMVASLPDKGRADRILISLGPGSFTGVRIGLAAARALGLAWGVEVLGYPTLALVAAMARHDHPGPVTVCMTGGHGEWFVQDFEADGLPEADIRSLPPAQAAHDLRHGVTAGSQAQALKALHGSPELIALDILPDARRLPLLPEALLTPDLSPLYGRAPDARLPT